MLWDWKCKGLTSTSWSLRSAPPRHPLWPPPFSTALPCVCLRCRILSLCLWEALHSKRREWGERGLCGAKERKRELALLSTDLFCVSALSLINDRLCESRPTALASGFTPCQRPKTQTTQHKTLLASKPRSCFTWGNVLLGAQVTNRCPFNLLWKTRAQLEMWHLLGWALETLRPPCGCCLFQLPQSGTELLCTGKELFWEMYLLAFSFISVAVATCFIMLRTTDDHRIKMFLAAMYSNVVPASTNRG